MGRYEGPTRGNTSGYNGQEFQAVSSGLKAPGFSGLFAGQLCIRGTEAWTETALYGSAALEGCSFSHA